MSYVDSSLRNEFESLPIDLKNEILSRGVSLYTLHDLKSCLESIISDDYPESSPKAQL